MIPSTFQIEQLRETLERSEVQITEHGQNLIEKAVNSNEIGMKVGFEAQLRTAKTILDQGEVDPEDLVIEPDIKEGDVDILVEYDQKRYHLQVGAKNFYNSKQFFPSATDKVDEFVESIKENPFNAAYDVLYKSPDELTAKVTKMRKAPGSAAKMSFDPGFFGEDTIRSKIAAKLGKASEQLGAKEDPLQYNVAVIGAHSFLAAGDDTYYRLTLDELLEYPGDYWNIDLVLIQSLRLDAATRSAGARLLPLRNPSTLPDVDTHIFGDTEGVQLYKIRFTVFPFQISEPGEHSIGIKNGRLHIDGYTGPKII